MTRLINIKKQFSNTNTIIYFHDIHDAKWFENIVIFLKKKYTMLGLDELFDAYNYKKQIRTFCHLTFDDGDTTFYKVIYPVLKKLNIPASVYVSPDAAVNQLNFWFQEIRGYEKQKLKQVASEIINFNIKKLDNYSIENILKSLNIDLIWEIINEYKKRYKPDKKQCCNMNKNQLLEIDRSKLVTLGAHTMKHPILANEEIRRAKNEIESSIYKLADLLGHEVNYFAYPNGIPTLDFGIREMAILDKYKCKLAFSTEEANFNLNSDRLSFPRATFPCGSFNSVRVRLFIKYRAKLLLGLYWEKLKDLKGENDISQRNKILKMIR